MSLARGVAFALNFVSVTVTGEANTTVAPTIYLRRDGFDQTPSVNTPAHQGHGQWELVLTNDEMNAANIGWVALAAGVVPTGGILLPESAYTAARATNLDRLDTTVSGVLTSVRSSIVWEGSINIPDSGGFGITPPIQIASFDTDSGAIRVGMQVRVDAMTTNYRRIISITNAQIGYHVTLDAPILAIAGSDVAIQVYRNAAPVDDYQQRAVAVTLPNPAPEGYGGSGSGGGGAVTIEQVFNYGDFPQSNTLTPIRLTAGDTAGSISFPLRHEDGAPILFAGNETVLFSLREKGADISIIDNVAATLSGADGDGARRAVFGFTSEIPVPASGDYEAKFQIGGLSYPVGRRQPVRITAEI